MKTVSSTPLSAESQTASGIVADPSSELVATSLLERNPADTATEPTDSPSEPIWSPSPTGFRAVDWPKAIPFLLLHAACATVFWVGWSPVAVLICLCAIYVRVFALTAFYHRYFSHKAFETSRLVQFLGGFVGCASAQRGPVWWAAHHRHHHRQSDEQGDAHSPRQHGFWWSHMWWFLTPENARTDTRVVKDWTKFPELLWLERNNMLPPVLMAGACFLLGWGLASASPAWNTGPWQILVWGFVISTVALYHITYCVNSVAHVIGTRRFNTSDDSRNNWVIALLTWGEGWHNNHHYYQRSARQGFYWWEIDVTYGILVVLSWFKIVWRLHQVPQDVLDAGRPAPASGEE